MNSKTITYIAIVAVLILGVFIGFWLRGLRPSPAVDPDIIRDTTWLHDTVKIVQPVPVNRWIHDTTYLAITDTALIHVHDTLFVPIPRETTFYSDSLYEAWVTGFRASLDSIHIFQSTAIVEVPVTKIVKKRWGVGVQVGGTYIPKTGFTPYVGIGISYNPIVF